jgi:hypothetical protein
MSHPRPSLLLVANWDSNVGYAWWLMESYWAVLARTYSASHRVLLAYPSISTLPETIRQAPIEPLVLEFGDRSFRAIGRQLAFIRANRVRTVYLSDRNSIDWLFPLFRIAGVRTIITHDHTPGEREQPTGVKRLLKRALHRVPGPAR